MQARGNKRVSKSHNHMPELLPYDLDKAVAAKEINDYMNHYLAALDSKAGLFLAGNVAAASLLLKEWPPDLVGKTMTVISISLFAAFSFAVGSVIFPRPRTNASA